MILVCVTVSANIPEGIENRSGEMGDDFDIHAFLAAEAAEAAMLAESAALAGGNNSNFPMEGLPDFYRLVWPVAEAIPVGWLNQTIDFNADKDSCVGIFQAINGPCGVLSVIQAVIFSNRLRNEKVVDVKKPVTDQEIATALADVARLSSVGKKHVQLASWKEIDGSKDIGRGIDIVEIDIDAAERVFLERIEEFKGIGGIPLFLYSVVATRGADNIRNDFALSGGGPSLVESTPKPDIWFCSSELMTLLVRGCADGNLGAYDQTGKKRVFSEEQQRNCLDIGMLSRKERETKLPVLDRLKFPSLPVWILHSGDHFTTLFQGSLENENELYHWNGLPPGGPRMTRLNLDFSQLAVATPDSIPQSDFIPLPGEIDDIVQADAEDKKKFPKDFSQWSFEVVLAVEDPTVKGAERPKGMKEEKFELGEKPEGKWRCANCYRNRHKTYCFGENKPGDDGVTAEECKFCGMRKEEAQWTIWLTYDQLPNKWKRSTEFHYGPKILSIVTTRWTDAKITEPAAEELPSC